jgi:hypothetical protein
MDDIDDILGVSEKEDSVQSDPELEQSQKTPEPQKTPELAELSAEDEHWLRFDLKAKKYAKSLQNMGSIDTENILKELQGTHFNIQSDADDIFEFNDKIQECQAKRDRISHIYLQVIPLAEIVSQAMKTLLIYGQKFSSETSEKKREASVLDRLEVIELGHLVEINAELNMICDTAQWAYRNLSGAHETLSRQITIFQERNRNDIHRGGKPAMYNDAPTAKTHTTKSPLDTHKITGRNKQISEDKTNESGEQSWGNLS